MKKLLFSLAIACLISIAATAQPYNNLAIQNTTSCNVYIELYGTTGSPSCATDYSSVVIMLPPGSYLWNPGTSPQPLTKRGNPPLTSSDGFTKVRVYHGDPSLDCVTAGYLDFSNCATGSITSTSSFILDHTTCLTCGSANIDWSIVSATTALLKIY